MLVVSLIFGLLLYLVNSAREPSIFESKYIKFKNSNCIAKRLQGQYQEFQRSTDCRLRNGKLMDRRNRQKIRYNCEAKGKMLISRTCRFLLMY